MMLFEITAIAEEQEPSGCCPSAVRHAGIGRARGPISAREVHQDMRRRTAEYYATIDGRYRDVIAAECLDCGEPFLTTATRFAARNELRALPLMAAERAASR